MAGLSNIFGSDNSDEEPDDGASGDPSTDEDLGADVEAVPADQDGDSPSNPDDEGIATDDGLGGLIGGPTDADGFADHTSSDS